MSLKDELHLRKGFSVAEHEAILNIYYTASMIKKRATQFFAAHGVTDVQFNMMLLLFHQSPPRGGLSQVELSEMMLVNRANITSLVDRMEKAGLVRRKADPDDRRSNIVMLSAKGRRILQKVDKEYIAEVKSIMSSLKQSDVRKLTSMLEKLRENISE